MTNAKGVYLEALQISFEELFLQFLFYIKADPLNVKHACATKVWSSSGSVSMMYLSPNVNTPMSMHAKCLY